MSDDAEGGHRLAAVTVRVQRVRERSESTLVAATARFPVLGAIVQAADSERRAGGVVLSGGLAYRLFFWLVPLGLISAAVSSFFTSAQSTSLESAAKKHGLTGIAANAAREAIDSNQRSRWYILVLGTVLVVWFGYGVVRTMNIVFALAWREVPQKVRRPVVAGTAFTIIAFVLSIAAVLADRAVSYLGLGFIVARLVAAVVYLGAGILVSLFFTHGGAPVRALVPGALFLSVGALALQAFAQFYLAPKVGRSVTTYGALGLSTVILLWLFLIARLITLSAFLNAGLWRRAESAAEPTR